jgi:5'-methylthioadenosine phosphorylase
MDPVLVGIIGGSGLYRFEGLTDVEEHTVRTPFGAPSDILLVGTLEGVRVAFLARHGRGHRISPTEVNYRANIFALKSAGVQHVVSVSACGSLREHLHPGEVVVPDQLLDLTRKRANSFFGNGLVAHVGVADPFCPRLQTLLADAVARAGGTVHRGGQFITVEGPRFSTKAESFTFRTWGMDIIGMTTSPEAFLAREAEMCYAVMAHVTDYDVWHESEEPVTVEMVVRILQRNTGLAQQAIRLLVPALVAGDLSCDCDHALAAALLTQPELIPDQVKQDLEPIVGKYLGS